MTPWRRARLLVAKGRQLAAIRRRALAGTDRRTVTLPAIGRERGRALFSFIIDPFLLRPDQPISQAHTHDWESLDMARAWSELGFRVDVMHWANDRFVPDGHYDVAIDVRYVLERLAPKLGPGCLKILHAETCEIGFHNAAEARRLAALEARRGVRLKPRRRMAPSRSLEVADVVTTLGNAFTAASFAGAGKPVYRVPISTTVTWPWPDGKDFAAARRRFLWFGSSGLVHKGLDLVLEAFAGMPDLALEVYGPVELEMDFVAAYEKELFATPNIRLSGWSDIASPSFVAAAARCAALVYPSCSEAGGGSVLTCMHAGLVPLVTEESSVDVPAGAGVRLGEASVPAVRAAVRELAAMPPDRLAAMSRAAWEFARANHTRERFAASYRETIRRIADKFGLVPTGGA